MVKKAYSSVTSPYRLTLTKDDVRAVRLNHESALNRWDKLCPEDQNQYIATELMGWKIGLADDTGFYLADGERIPLDDFKPAECLVTAQRLFESFLIPDKMTIHPCDSSTGLFWMVYFEDAYIGVGKTLQQALCKASIVISRAASWRLYEEQMVQRRIAHLRSFRIKNMM